MIYASLPNEMGGFSLAGIDRLPIAILFFNQDLRLAIANRAAQALLEMPGQEMFGRPAGEVCPGLVGLLQRARGGEAIHEQVHCSGALQDRAIQAYIAPLTDRAAGAANCMVLLFETARQNGYTSERQPALPAFDAPARALLDCALESIRLGVLLVDADGSPIYHNPNLLRLWEEPAYDRRQLGSGWLLILGRHLKHPERLLRLMQLQADQPAAEIYDFLELTSGRVLECHSRLQYPTRSGAPVRVWSFEDITEQQRTERELHYLSTHDGLTGLYNRAYFELQIRQAQTYPAYPISMIVIDVDGLKKVNDSFGHPAGDLLLVRTADVLRRACRSEDVLARLGGDEFGVLLPRTDQEAAENVIERVQNMLRLQLADGSQPLLTLSLGAASAESSETLTTLFNRADAQMYHGRKCRRAAGRMRRPMRRSRSDA